MKLKNPSRLIMTLTVALLVVAVGLAVQSVRLNRVSSEDAVANFINSRLSKGNPMDIYVIVYRGARYETTFHGRYDFTINGEEILAVCDAGLFREPVCTYEDGTRITP